MNRSSALLLLASLLSGSMAASSPSRPLPRESSVLKMVDSQSESWCTIFSITPDGTFVTALHCVRECLSEAGQIEQAQSRSVGLFDLAVVRDPIHHTTLCPRLKVPALKSNAGDVSVEVVGTGLALSSYDVDFQFDYAPYYSELKNLGWQSRANDFAFLRLRSVASGHLIQNKSCLAVEPDYEPKSADTVTAAGYPVQSDPKVKAVYAEAQGRVYGSPEQSAYYRRETTTKGRQWAKDLYGSAGVIYSDARTREGYSGGPIMSGDPDHARVVGIVSGYTQVGDGSLETHELVGTSLAHALSLMPPGFVNEIRAKNRQCSTY